MTETVFKTNYLLLQKFKLNENVPTNAGKYYATEIEFLDFFFKFIQIKR